MYFVDPVVFLNAHPDPVVFLNADPDPVVFLNADPDPVVFLNAVPDLDPALQNCGVCYWPPISIPTIEFEL